MKIKVLFSVLILGAIAALSISGFQLKDTEAENTGSESDRLIGAVITRESLNTFDFEAYAEENIEDIIRFNGGEITADNSNHNKIYAKPKDITLTDEAGEKSTHKEYIFEDIDGFWIFDAQIAATETEELYTVLCSEGGVSDTHTKIHRTDEELELMELTATVYHSIDDAANVFYLNPVYQESDGDVYCIEGSGLSVSGITQGSESSQSLSSKITVNKNGEEKVYESKVTVKFIYAEIPETTSFIFMDKDNKTISAEDFSPTEIPEKITVPKDTEYIIINEKSLNGGNTQVVGKNEEYGYFFTELEKGILEKRSVQFVWE